VLHFHVKRSGGEMDDSAHDEREPAMTQTVDARGLACPQPVILTRNALQESAAVTTIVDHETAQRNVTRMAQKAGCSVQVETQEDGIYLHISGGRPTSEQPVARESTPSPGGALVLVVSSDTMGRGDAELGQILIRGFFHALGEVQPLPETIILFNSGVRLATEGSPVLEDLRSLCGRGVEVLACGTCLDFYELKDRVAVGEVSNMYTIAETMLRAGKVISL
jgi:selenium metabolism protein YedF